MARLRAALAALLALLAVWCAAATHIPLDASDNSQLYWGSYRPGLYFGMKARSEHTFETGFMYAIADDPSSLHHRCLQEDKLERYGWLLHDGRNFGEHEITDRRANLVMFSSFVKFNHSASSPGIWSNRFTGQPMHGGLSNPVSVFYYVALPPGSELENVVSLKGLTKKGIKGEVAITGSHPEIGHFSLVFKDAGLGNVNRVVKIPRSTQQVIKTLLPDLSRTHVLGLRLNDDSQFLVEEHVKRELERSHAVLQREWTTNREKLRAESLRATGKPPVDDDHHPLLIATLPNTIAKGSNVLVIQRVLGTPFELDVAFVPHALYTDKPKLTDEQLSQIVGKVTTGQLTAALEEYRKTFPDRIENTFQLKKLRVNPALETLVYPIFSNLIGGIGFFRGRSVIQDKNIPPYESTAVQSLYTAVPSRPFFPRGFMWDEGFHQLLVADWDPRITVQVLSHWLNLMDDNGWIGREQILGNEARSRVPREFLAQHKDNGNPPTFFLTVKKLLNKAVALGAAHEADAAGEHVDLAAASADSERQLLSSFLHNAYPALERYFQWYQRSQAGVAPNSFRWRGRTENHTFTSGLDDYPRSRFPSDDELHVDLLSWMAMAAGVLADVADFVGRDGSAYRAKRHNYIATLDALHWNDALHTYSDVEHYRSGAAPEFATHIGYVTLAPFFLGLIPHDSPKLLYTLKLIENENKLWTPYGLRSLAKDDKFYGTSENYWRGPIWININYLVLASLKQNYVSQGPHREMATKIYTQLREKLALNVLNEYQLTGYVWEQYDPKTGKGKRSHPFTGWSALVINILAEKF